MPCGVILECEVPAVRALGDQLAGSALSPRVRIVVTVFLLFFLKREAIGNERCRDIRWS